MGNHVSVLKTIKLAKLSPVVISHFSKDMHSAGFFWSAFYPHSVRIQSECHPEVFYKKVVLKNLAKFKESQMDQSLLFNNPLIRVDTYYDPFTWHSNCLLKVELKTPELSGVWLCLHCTKNEVSH